MRKTVVFLTTATLIMVSLAGCGKKQSAPAATETVQTTAAAESKVESAAAPETQTEAASEAETEAAQTETAGVHGAVPDRETESASAG